MQGTVSIIAVFGLHNFDSIFDSIKTVKQIQQVQLQALACYPDSVDIAHHELASQLCTFGNNEVNIQARGSKLVVAESNRKLYTPPSGTGGNPIK